MKATPFRLWLLSVLCRDEVFARIIKRKIRSGKMIESSPASDFYDPKEHE